jgi:predicted ATPase
VGGGAAGAEADDLERAPVHGALGGVNRLRRLTITPPADGGDAYPFSVPAVRQTSVLDFETPVTFFVGENGSGKSTLLEGLGAKVNLSTVGTTSVEQDDTLSHARRLAGAMRLSWSSAGRAHRGFFLRAEDFFGFTRSLNVQKAALRREIEQVHVEYEGRSAIAKALRLGPLMTSLSDIENRYGADFDAQSHGESFLSLFRGRFVADGLYLMDEPEAALSPTSQLALLAMLQDMVKDAGQFIIATHSPILLALPGATIWSFDERPPRAIAYDESEHVRVTRDFLNAPERFLRHL